LLEELLAPPATPFGEHYSKHQSCGTPYEAYLRLSDGQDFADELRGYPLAKLSLAFCGILVPDGTGQEYLTDGAGFSWSPDGTRLAFATPNNFPRSFTHEVRRQSGV
jgi:hypothetical protein